MPIPRWCSNLGQRAIVVIRKHVGERAAKIPQKSIAHISAFHNAASKHWQIGPRIVTASLLKFAQHFVGPVLHSRFPAIHHHIAQAFSEQRAQGLRQRIGVSVEVFLDILAA